MEARGTLDPQEAGALTERIRDEAQRTWALLVEAYEREAWAALGYPTWDEYVTAEFDLGIDPAMRLLERAHLVPVDDAEPGPSELSEQQARDLVDQVVLSLQALTAGLDMIDLSTLPPDPTAGTTVDQAGATLGRLAQALHGTT